MPKELATLAPLQPMGQKKPSLVGSPQSIQGGQRGPQRQPLAPPGLQSFRDMQRAGQARPPRPQQPLPRTGTAAPPSPYTAVRTPSPQLTGPANAAGNGYRVENGVLVGSNYADTSGRDRNQSLPVQYDYSSERSHNGYADMTDEQYQELLSLGETNVRDNFESYIGEDGQVHWRYAAGAGGHSAEDRYYGGYRHDANGYPIDEFGNRIQLPGQPPPPPRDGGSADYNRYAGGGSFDPTGAGHAPYTRQRSGASDPNSFNFRPGEGGFALPNRGAIRNGLDPFTGGSANLVGGAPTGQWSGLFPKNGQPPVPPPNRPPAEEPGPYDPGPAWQPPAGGGPTAGDSGFDPLDWMEDYFGGGRPEDRNQALLRQKLGEFVNNPSGWDDELIQQEIQRGGEQIDDDFAIREDRLAEEMAARGLSDSSIRGGRMSDLNVARKSAETDLNERVLARAADTRGQDMARAYSMLSNFDNQDFSNDMQMLMALLGFGQQGFENDMTLQEFMRRLQNDQDALAMFGAGA